MAAPLLNDELNASQIEIVTAAAKCFMQSGYENTTITEIAEELGCTKGRVYHYFRSKSAIFFAVYRQAMAYCFEAGDPVVALPLSGVERLVRLCEAHALVMINTRSFQRGIKQGLEIYMRGSTTDAERVAFQEMLALRDNYEALFRQVLSEGVADGTLDVDDVPLAGRTILSALNGLPDWYRERPGGEAPAEIARKTADYIVSGFRMPPRGVTPRVARS